MNFANFQPYPFYLLESTLYTRHNYIGHRYLTHKTRSSTNIDFTRWSLGTAFYMQWVITDAVKMLLMIFDCVIPSSDLSTIAYIQAAYSLQREIEIKFILPRSIFLVALVSRSMGKYTNYRIYQYCSRFNYPIFLFHHTEVLHMGI